MALPPEMFTLVAGDLYAWKLSRLGTSEDLDSALSDLLFALARLAPDFPLEEGSDRVRVMRSRPMLPVKGRFNGHPAALFFRLIVFRTRQPVADARATGT